MTARAVRRWLLAMATVATQVGLVVVIHVLGREAGAWEHTGVATDPILARVATWGAFTCGCVLAAVWVMGAERHLQLGEAHDELVDEVDQLRDELAAWEAWAAAGEPVRVRHLAPVPDVVEDHGPDRTLVDATLTHPVGGR